MAELKLKDKDIAVPGEPIAVGMDVLPGAWTYRDHDIIRASRLGIVNIDRRTVKLLPLSGRYTPKKGDVIIGKVIDLSLNGWRLDTNTAYSAMLSVRDASSDFIQRGADLTQYFNIGEYIVCKIVNVTSQKLVDVAVKGPGLRKLKGGRIIGVDSNKVPRIIGKQGSMVSMIKKETNCNIVVGQNGIIWLDGEPEQELKAIQTIRKIEKESHLTGLTDKIKEYLNKK